MSRFSDVKMGPPIEVFALNKAFAEDTFEKKVSLGVGGKKLQSYSYCTSSGYRVIIIIAYRNNEGKPWVLPVVRTAEKALALDDTLNKEYLPVLGLETFSTLATKMLLGDDSPAVVENRVTISSFKLYVHGNISTICLIFKNKLLININCFFGNINWILNNLKL